VNKNDFEQRLATNSKYVRILRVIDRITEWEGMIFSSFLLVATIQICYELVLRYFFNAPTLWGLEMSLYVCSITYLMSGAYTEYHNAHIKVDLFYNRWSLRTQAIFDLALADMLRFLFSGTLVWFSAEWFWDAWANSLTSGTAWDPPIWPMRLAIFVGSCFLLLAGINTFVRDLVNAFKKRPSGQAPEN